MHAVDLSVCTLWEFYAPQSHAHFISGHQWIQSLCWRYIVFFPLMLFPGGPQGKEQGKG